MARKPTRAGKAKTAKARPVKRPPEVPAAQWRGLGASQRQRYAAFYRLHPGQPLYRARGKGAAEHLTRRVRDEAEFAALAARQERRGGRDAESLIESYRALVRDQGKRAFTELSRAIEVRQRGVGWIDTMEMFGWDWSDYDGEPEDLHYN